MKRTTIEANIKYEMSCIGNSLNVIKSQEGNGPFAKPVVLCFETCRGCNMKQYF